MPSSPSMPIWRAVQRVVPTAPIGALLAGARQLR
jgi:hypothetical protein